MREPAVFVFQCFVLSFNAQRFVRFLALFLPSLWVFGLCRHTHLQIMAPKLDRKRAREDAAADRALRHERLACVKGLSGVSDNALCKILNTARANGLFNDGGSDIKVEELHTIGHEVFSQVRRTETYRLADGSDFLLEFCDPNLLLSKLVGESPALQRMYAEAFARTPCREDAPWSLVLTFDEYSPGNALAHNNKAKTMNFNFACKELQSSLDFDDVWC